MDTPRRQRSNTASTSFAPFSWRRTRQDVSSLQPTSPPLQLEDLIQALTPPAVPSLTHARSLATALVTQSPLPPLHVLNPIVTSLCSTDCPVSLQNAGYDIMSAYWENNNAPTLLTSDRLTHFSLFLGKNAAFWSHELWESRFKALRTLTKSGSEIQGIESHVIDVIKSWLQGAFNGLLTASDPVEQAERERSINVLAIFLSSIIENPEVSARFPDDKLSGILQFYDSLVDHSMDVPLNSSIHATSSTLSSPIADLLPSSSSSPRPTSSHRRHPSSLSIASSVPRPMTPPSKHPADIAIALYLDHLSKRLRSFGPDLLSSILPSLFRALAFYASPLPRLSVMARSRLPSRPEERIAETLDLIFSGSYSTNCMNILKRHLFPPVPSSPQNTLQKSIQISIGAHRTLRNYIRKGLCTRLARAYISRESSLGYSHSGAPGRLDVERELMERAWPKDNVSGWDSGQLGPALHQSVKAWVSYEYAWDGVFSSAREKVLDEAAGTLKDILHELDSRENTVMLEDDEACAVGETLHQLAMYIHTLRFSAFAYGLVLKLIRCERNPDNSPFIIPLIEPMEAPTPFLRTLSFILSRDHATDFKPLLSTTLLALADHLTDADTAKLPVAMSEQHNLSPASPDWLTNWEQLLLGIPPLLHSTRPLTRAAIINSLDSVHRAVKDIPTYRRPLANLVWESCQRLTADPYREEYDNTEILWRILGDEIVQRTIEDEEADESVTGVNSFIELLKTVAAEGERTDDTDTISVANSDPQSPSSVLPSAVVSPILSRTQGEFLGKDRDSSLPSVISLLSSLATGSTSRSQSMQPQAHEDSPDISSYLPQLAALSLPREVSAAVALVYVFTQLSFTPHTLPEKTIQLALQVYLVLLDLLHRSKSERTRLTILQFLVRLRADRDHRLYYVDTSYDPDGHVPALASLIYRVWDPSSSRRPRYERSNDDVLPVDDGEIRKARTRTPRTRDGRQVSTVRGGRPSQSGASRSRSRIANTLMPTTPAKSREPLWRLPETLPFFGAEVDTPSESLISYDPAGLQNKLILPVSDYLDAIVQILERERNWEILSYVLCHLPVQLANKHLFCGPIARMSIVKIVTTLCNALINADLANEVEYWPLGLRARDAQGLAYHTLSVLISYPRCIDIHLRHVLVEVFLGGLDGQPSTIKCCLHALSLSAFELQSSMTKYLSKILEKLSRIMSNPDMAVHIINFLSIVGSLQSLHANFTESDYKMAFAVALQYLQHHNEPGSSPTSSWALSQHVRILSYYTVYVWFLSVRLSDRPLHINFITRQLLLANEGKPEVDEQTEVCFDWLDRFTYASAEPRPASSVLSDIMNPTLNESSSESSATEKACITGNAIVTTRTLPRRGWVEVVTRRPSGYTKSLCRIENAPMMSADDVDPDLTSDPVTLLMEHDSPKTQAPLTDLPTSGELQGNIRDVLATDAQTEQAAQHPDPITGYVWSGSAPSQRHKEATVDPASSILQLSSNPGLISAPQLQRIEDTSGLPGLCRTLDRIPVIDTHKVGIMYVAPGQTHELEILRNTHGSPAYTQFLEGIGKLIHLRGQFDVYAGGLNPDEDGEYAYAWWDDIGQILFHTATMMPSHPDDEYLVNKKRHIGNDYVRIVWNDSGMPYNFNTLATQFQFVNIVIEPHSLGGAIAAFSSNIHETEYFKITVQRAPGMTEFSPVGEFKLISAENLPLLVRQLCLLSDWFASIFQRTQCDTERVEMTTNWRARLQTIKRFQKQLPTAESPSVKGITDQAA